MPELPEVDTVRAGLQRWIAGRRIGSVDSLHPRAVRRHLAGPDDLASRLAGRTISSVNRRGKYLWLTLDDGPDCLIAHLGMSGQLLLLPADAPAGGHLRARFRFADDGPELRFIDQRTFGGVHLDELVQDGPTTVPQSIAHIARDPLDEHFDDAAWITGVRRRSTTIKRALLDQSSLSGVGNIYADEALWRARLHGDRPTGGLSRAQLATLLAELRAVFREALRAGGTSFDALYVNVNGESGYFDRSLNAYGREHEPCRRCGRPIARARWMNRSSYFCPSCQRPPRSSSTVGTAARSAARTAAQPAARTAPRTAAAVRPSGSPPVPGR
ncbi:bifunctional DNA-formamidopyrimidine glycosylase/DNA-(apurinic or apyrimidinic site) lyase [Jatrophihabitans telluris]|uniref:Formamidopyrimidine-DNA glycosylase n=1 Tax=Jatrophihabitans telluris TaxID=2038343 RepID=A0ABY4R361_9ACTN|nr:bifunctional DNA-formamidopyrimidine glycosylase/DNA-(apurinic or apyrimidinic site) lyase [Jatrophihabitans telluris]UQX89972.1 bifunctional DNA-formamidopyrimidine glycosylase/DNA-(apurinic or apyrimidinic site) lyase [Jatrophihabitans telluris]